MIYTVDRIEGEYAVCEDQNRVIHDIPLSQLPEGVKDGSKLEYLDEVYTLLPEVDQSGIQARFMRLLKCRNRAK